MVTGSETRSPEDVAKVMDQLTKILASPGFTRSSRMQRFLQFVVSSALEGQFDVLKESYIGATVFERAPTYDPKLDPIVRVEARRLRTKLQTYYETEGSVDRIVIHLPKGGYLPTFEEVDLPAAAEKSSESFNPQDGMTEIPSPATTIGPLSAPERPAAGWSRRYSTTVVLSAVVLVLATLLVAIAMHRGWRPSKSATIVPLTTFLGQEFDPAISPDGKHLAFVWNGDSNNYDIYIKTLGSGDIVRLTTSPAHDLHPAWSPDGRDIAFVRMSPEKSELMVVPALGGPERSIGPIHNAVNIWKADASQMIRSLGPAWSADGRSLVVTDDPDGANGLYLWPLGYGEKRRLTTAPAGNDDFYPSMSSDGRNLAFARQTSNSAGDLFLLSLENGSLRQLTSDRRGIRGLTWSPDGSSILFSSNRSGIYSLWTISTGGGSSTSITTNSNEATDPSITNDGLIAFTDTAQNSNIWRLDLRDPNHQDRSRLISSSRKNDSPQYSPDGQKIVFVSDRTGNWELWVSNHDGSSPRQLTSFQGPMLGTPHWSPDGKSIAFDARPSGHSAIYLVSIDHGPANPIETNSFEERMPSWSHDGQWLYFSSNRGGKVQLWKRHISDGKLYTLTQKLAYDSFESPDGFWVYFRSDGLGIWKVSVDGEGEFLVPELRSVDASRYVAAAGGNLYFVADETTPSLIRRYDFKTRHITTVGAIERNLVDGTPSLSVSSDEHWLLYAQQDEGSSDIMSLRPQP